METGAAPKVDPSTPRGARRQLSAELRTVAELFSQDAVTLRDVINQLGEHASGWIILLLALPFCAPITLPAVSTPFGLIIAVLAVRYALGLPPWLPKKLLNVKLPPRFFRTVAKGSERFVCWIEKRLRPRWSWVAGSSRRARLHAWSIAFSAVLLALPLGGIPFTNTLPGLALFIGVIGIMERDGIAVLISHALLAATLIYFGCFAAIFVEMMDHLINWWRV